ncbi:hypothetical protein San01_50750 [Streptomyces angustmyceticus]|uniref:Uncharacterized protein n=1 Tax=Streptomyces angustmyceticus TaxID=285578 RepID=A0A5J4LQ68_9ACTN|nr:hypothetical protein San01_50750 [Streptomyces angustmyceticus]
MRLASLAAPAVGQAHPRPAESDGRETVVDAGCGTDRDTAVLLDLVPDGRVEIALSSPPDSRTGTLRTERRAGRAGRHPVHHGGGWSVSVPGAARRRAGGGGTAGTDRRIPTGASE